MTLVVEGEITPALLDDVVGPEHTVTPRTEAGVLEIHGPVDPALMTTLCATLERAGIQLISLATRTRSLEDVFLDLTGRELR